jgi:hypothetical protein
MSEIIGPESSAQLDVIEEMVGRIEAKLDEAIDAASAAELRFELADLEGYLVKIDLVTGETWYLPTSHLGDTPTWRRVKEA